MTPASLYPAAASQAAATPEPPHGRPEAPTAAPAEPSVPADASPLEKVAHPMAVPKVAEAMGTSAAASHGECVGHMTVGMCAGGRVSPVGMGRGGSTQMPMGLWAKVGRSWRSS